MMSLWRIAVLGVVLAATQFAGSAIACPNPDMAAARQISSNGAALRLGQSRRVFAGGKAGLDGCAHIALPHIPTAQFNDAPGFSADLSGMIGLAMEIRAESDCATALLVRTDGGHWYFDDHGRGAGQPRLILRRPGSGEITVWLGTPDGRQCRARLNLQTYAGQ
ncbi:hypothetical protein [Loktanella sp. R86503]|uniref:hypothetical protein n=1 Tax=Loktanella sp. R86503 TaxID=3093847 RepID=UPI0036D9DEF3